MCDYELDYRDEREDDEQDDPYEGYGPDDAPPADDTLAPRPLAYTPNQEPAF